MLVSLCLVLEARRPALLPPTWGRAAQGLFLKKARELDGVLADRLHVPQAGPRPYTIGFSHHGRSGLGKPEVWLRITGLDERTSRRLLEMIREPGHFDFLRLFTAEFELKKVCRHPEEHPWAGEGSFMELYNNWVARAKEGDLPETIHLEFHSPTAFSVSGSQWDLPLPLPRLVFQSLWNKWAAFAPVPLKLSSEDVGRYVGIKRHRLETRMLHFGGAVKQVGFIGECEFAIRREAGVEFSRAINLLADFAFFAGVGKKTSWGMGQVRRGRGRGWALE